MDVLNLSSGEVLLGIVGHGLAIDHSFLLLVLAIDVAFCSVSNRLLARLLNNVGVAVALVRPNLDLQGTIYLGSKLVVKTLDRHLVLVVAAVLGTIVNVSCTIFASGFAIANNLLDAHIYARITCAQYIEEVRSLKTVFYVLKVGVLGLPGDGIPFSNSAIGKDGLGSSSTHSENVHVGCTERNLRRATGNFFNWEYTCHGACIDGSNIAFSVSHNCATGHKGGSKEEKFLHELKILYVVSNIGIFLCV